MKVILLDNVKGIGRIGELKDVHDGYARNFLFPRRLGKPATDAAIREVAAHRNRVLELKALSHSEALSVIKTLQGATVTLQAKANKKGTLFSGISHVQLADAISKATGARISPDTIAADDHLKTLGQHTVYIRLAEDATAEVSVRIEPL